MLLVSMLAAARIAGADEWAVIRDLRAERGIIAGDVSMAQVALARWMIGGGFVSVAAGEQLPCGRLIKGLTDGEMVRYLTGETEPDFGTADLIAAKTCGAVSPPMWAKRAEMPKPAKALAEQGGAAARPTPRTRPPQSFECELVLVERPAEFGAMLNNGDLVIVGPADFMRVPQAAIRGLFNQMGPLLATIETGVPG
jgi:hypothetical protein